MLLLHIVNKLMQQVKEILGTDYSNCYMDIHTICRDENCEIYLKQFIVSTNTYMLNKHLVI